MKIFFISSGTSCNDYISSLNDIISKNKTLFKLSDKIKLLEINRLNSNGIKEMYITQQNPIFISKLLTDKSVVFTELDYDTIESSLVLYNSKIDKIIYPIPIILDKVDKKKYIPLIKNLFGKNPDETKKYWKEKNLNNDFFNVKEKVPFIDWKYIEEKTIVYQYNLSQLKKFILSTFYSSLYEDKTIILIVRPSIIYSILKECSETKYIPEIHTLERSSIWEIEVRKENQELNFKKYDKIYPTEFNYSPLKKRDILYQYEFKNNPYNLICFPKLIPQSFIEKMVLTRFPTKDKDVISKIISKLTKKENGINNGIKNKPINEDKNESKNKNEKITFENILSI